MSLPPRLSGLSGARHSVAVRRTLAVLRQSILSLAVLLCAGAAAYASWHDVRHTVQQQPDPLGQVDAGTVPIISARWSSRTGSMILPQRALGSFREADTPVAGSTQFLEVLHLVPGQDPVANPVANGSAALRYIVELRAVQATRLHEQGYISVTNLQPSDLVVARYIVNLGNGDSVRAESPSTRLLDYPVTPPTIPVVVQLEKDLATVQVTVTQTKPGWSAIVYPLGADQPVALQPAKRLGVLQLRFQSAGTDGLQAMLASSDRPTVNLGWLVVRNAQGVVQVSTALRY